LTLEKKYLSFKIFQNITKKNRSKQYFRFLGDFLVNLSDKTLIF
jgi:hypothetical protein